MIPIICIDDKGGMMFNRRRQSKDSVLRGRVLDMAAGSKLLMNAYSAGQFEEENTIITISEDFLNEAAEGEFCFTEDQPLLPHKDRIEKLIVYKWNRSYPGDLMSDIDLSAWTLTQSTDFEGSSHEKITEEIYLP